MQVQNHGFCEFCIHIGFADDEELDNSHNPSPDQGKSQGEFEDPELYEIAQKLKELEASDSEEDNLCEGDWSYFVCCVAFCSQNLCPANASLCSRGLYFASMLAFSHCLMMNSCFLSLLVIVVVFFVYIKFRLDLFESVLAAIFF